MSEHQQPPSGGGRGELGPPKADFSAPPPYEALNTSEALEQQQQQQHEQQHNHALPPHTPQSLQEYEAALQQHCAQQQQQQQHGKLPTYEEVQLEKSLNGELPPAFMSAHTPMPPPPPNPLLAGLRDTHGSGGGGGGLGDNSPPPALTFIAIDANDPDHLTGADSSLLGTDIMFVTAFVVAFLFNWIGFLLLTCFCHTIAARYGALSGFGLSLAKWTLIVKHSTDLASHENSWLWWLIMAFGFLICVRALIQYVSIKRTWRLLSSSAQDRLLFFY